MGRKQRREHKKYEDAAALLHPVMTKIPIVQKIIVFGGKRARFPLIASTVTSTWRETVTEFDTALLCWSKQLHLLRRSKDKSRQFVAGPRAGEVEQIDEKSGGLEFIHKTPFEGSHFYTIFCLQLQEIFNRAVCGGNPRWPRRPIAPLNWLVKQMLPLCGLSSTEKNVGHEEFFRFIGGQEDGMPIDINFHVNVPPFWEIQEEDFCGERYEIPEDFAHKWERAFGSNDKDEMMKDNTDWKYLYALDEDLLPDIGLLRPRKSNIDHNQGGDDDDNEDYYDSSNDDDEDEGYRPEDDLRIPQTSFGFAPLFFIAAANEEIETMKLLLSTGKIAVENCFCTGNGLSVLNLCCAQLYTCPPIIKLLIDNSQDPQKFINAKDRTGSFPLALILKNACRPEEFLEVFSKQYELDVDQKVTTLFHDPRCEWDNIKWPRRKDYYSAKYQKSLRSYGFHDGTTALMVAASRKLETIIKDYLIGMSKDPKRSATEIKDAAGLSASMIAIERNCDLSSIEGFSSAN